MTDHLTARDLIKRLTDELEFWSDLACTPSELPFEQDDMLKLITKARAYLAQPEPKRPTVMEIIALADEIEEEELGQVDLVRRALELWGHQRLTPIPLTERQPTEADCDAHGWCWMFSPADLNVGLFGVAARWCLRKPDPEIDEDLRTHWLPHWALPLPHS